MTQIEFQFHIIIINTSHLYCSYWSIYYENLIIVHVHVHVHLPSDNSIVYQCCVKSVYMWFTVFTDVHVHVHVFVAFVQFFFVNT